MYRRGCHTALLKLGFTLEDAARVERAAEPHTVRDLTSTFRELPHVSPIGGHRIHLHQNVTIPEAFTNFARARRYTDPLWSRMADQLEAMRGTANEQALTGTVLGHELGERLHARRWNWRKDDRLPFEMTFGHHPDVILREHNILATLPPELQPTRDFFQTFRLHKEAPLLEQATGNRFTYGIGERMSRHARRHIAKLLGKLG